MLLEFTVNNFRSFNTPTTISMECGKYLRKFKENTSPVAGANTLKSALVFGGNANGKSNVINMFLLLQRIVCFPTHSEIDQLAVDTFGNNSDNTSFYVKFIKDKSVYEYDIEYNEEAVYKEELIVDGKVILKRSVDELIIPELIQPLIGTLRKNQLLLYFSQTYNVKEAKVAFSWFAEDIIFIRSALGIRFRLERLLLDIGNIEGLKEKLIAFLQAADFNVLDIEVRKKLSSPNGDENEMIKMMRADGYILHKGVNNKNFWLHINDESDGTRMFLLLTLSILLNQGQERVFLIDEFDQSLHIKLTEVVLKLMNEWNRSGHQFILTTHEYDLMDCNMRADQIWFVEKNEYGESNLYSMFDFTDTALTRNDYKYKKRYIEGVYGADQIINYVALEKLIEESQNE